MVIFLKVVDFQEDHTDGSTFDFEVYNEVFG